MPDDNNPNPGHNSSPYGHDLYLNPYWALKFMAIDARSLCERMTAVLGDPDLWFNGSFNELLWGPRNLHRDFRPGIHVNISGTNGKVWISLWLPWRSNLMLTLPGGLNDASKAPAHCNTLDSRVELDKDLYQFEVYAKAVKELDSRNPVNLSAFEAVEPKPEEAVLGVF